MADPEIERLCAENMGLVMFAINRRVLPCLSRGTLRAAGGVDELRSVGYVALVKAARYFDPARAKFSTFACNVVLRDIWAYVNKQERQSALTGAELDDVAGREQEPGHDAERDDDLAQLRRALGRLRPRYRQILEMRFFEKLNGRKIANRLGVSFQRIYQLEDSARRELRKILTESRPPVAISPAPPSPSPVIPPGSSPLALA